MFLAESLTLDRIFGDLPAMRKGTEVGGFGGHSFDPVGF